MSKLATGALGALAALVLAITIIGGAISLEYGVRWHNTSTTQRVAGEFECTVEDPDALRSALVRVTGWDRTQVKHATTVYLVAAERGLGERAALIGIMTARTESRMYNYANFTVEESLQYDYDRIGQDHDSVGIFQQRPSSGWGSVRDLMSPEYAAGKFYDKLVTINDWDTMDPGAAAQAVQISAFPDAYSRYQSIAEKVVAAFASHVTCIAVSSEWTHPVPAGALWSGFRTPERPTHDGIDFGAEPGTEILAVGAGTVIRVRCNATLNGQTYSCDIDGSPSVRGCGWYADIEHGDGTVTRYCHMLTAPLVAVGDAVQTGQVIGYIGNSGNSSAPHLHFETHMDSPATSSNAVDPVTYLAERAVHVN
jgi:murein DD-endopeptidase MepM/ murein hydrolase activator NlpD